MASSLNASTAGGGGVIVTSDATGNLDIQSGGSTVVAVTSTGATVTGTLAVTGAVTLTASLNTPNTFGFKNRIINGGMVIDQRNAGASVTPASGAYLTDRFGYSASQASKVTAQQSTTATAGFINSLLFTSSSAYTVGASEVFNFSHKIEGLNIADLAWGTASAATVTLSFWARSSLTGTFGGSLQNSAQNRSYPFAFTILSANTFEYKTVTIAGDTTGTWLTTNGIGIQLNFSLGCGATFTGTAGAWAAADYRNSTGAVSVVGTNGATFYITGVQLEKGSTATSFDFRAYSTELAMCQRYYVQYFGTSTYEYCPSFLIGYSVATNAYGQIYLPVTMRASPSVSASNFIINDETAPRVGTSLAVYTTGQSNKLLSVLAQAASGITANRPYNLSANNSTSAYIQISSEL